jgi:aminopeptidase N
MQHAPTIDQRITWFRAFRSYAETPGALEQVRSILDGKLTVPGMPLKPLDRWSLIIALLGHGYADAPKLLEAERKRDTTDDGRKYGWIADAARPDAAVKRRFFDDYLHNRSLAEDWVEGSLGPFNQWNQSSLTLPYLKPALEALPQVKRERRIFFVLAWLHAFIGGQDSEAAAAIVRDYLRNGNPEPDLRLKILEVADGLERAVRIRQAFR